MESGTKNGEKPNMDSIRISTDSMVKRRLDANINHFYEKFHFYQQFFFYILLYLTDLPEIVYHVFHTDIFLHRQQNRYVRLAIYTDPLTLISKKSSKRNFKKTEKVLDIRGFRFLPETFYLCIWVNKLSRYFQEYHILNWVSSCQNFQKQPSLYIFFPVLTSKYNFWGLVVENIVCFCCTKQLDVSSLMYRLFGHLLFWHRCNEYRSTYYTLILKS